MVKRIFFLVIKRQFRLFLEFIDYNFVNFCSLQMHTHLVDEIDGTSGEDRNKTDIK
jgi:hypothetical protein